MLKKDNILRYGIIGLYVLWLILTYPKFYPLPEITAIIVNFFLNILKISSIVYNSFLLVDFGERIRIFHLSAECAGVVLFSVFLFGSFIVPKFKLKHRMIALLFIPILVLGNSLRILLSVILAKNYSVDFSLFFHNTFGQVLIFSLGIFSYIGWLKITGNFPSFIKQKDL